MEKSIPVASLHSTYQIFAEELSSHVAFFKQVLARLEDVVGEQAIEEELRTKAKKLEHRFHLLKGGAGFLQLKEIAEASLAGETLFKGGKLHESPSKLNQELTQIVETIESELSQLKEVLLAET